MEELNNMINLNNHEIVVTPVVRTLCHNHCIIIQQKPSWKILFGKQEIEAFHKLIQIYPCTFEDTDLSEPVELEILLVLTVFLHRFWSYFLKAI